MYYILESTITHHLVVLIILSGLQKRWELARPAIAPLQVSNNFAKN